MIFKIAGIGILVTVINMILTKAGRDEYAMLTTLTGIIVVVLMLLEDIKKLFVALENLFGI